VVSYTNAPSELSELGIVSGDSSLVILRPAEWIGKRLPLVRMADLPAEVGQGEWLVVLHSRTCDHCRELVPLMIERIAASPDTTASPRLALVDLAPGTPLYQDQPHVISRALPDTHQWFVSPPVAVRVRDGVVVATHEDMDQWTVRAIMPYH
jgi:hypothetical protein